ncbi:hypothetical protein Trydic_g18150 [Trypoxylus dichotomus]
MVVRHRKVERGPKTVRRIGRESLAKQGRMIRGNNTGTHASTSSAEKSGNSKRHSLGTLYAAFDHPSVTTSIWGRAIPVSQ